MEITPEILDKYLTDFRNQQQQLTSQIHAISGAIQILEVLRNKLAETDPDEH